ncbi:hypothetical protein CA951_37765 [Rhodococcus sp. NCIMB 12038]|nr:hypothetical protein CA951_37765 [Rhodococcus sp. NCIMB 12038]
MVRQPASQGSGLADVGVDQASNPGSRLSGTRRISILSLSVTLQLKLSRCRDELAIVGAAELHQFRLFCCGWLRRYVESCEPLSQVPNSMFVKLL